KRLDPDSGRRQGLFQAAKELRESGDLTAVDHQRLDAIRSWFNDYLEKPTRLSLSPRPNRKAQAISWFKDTATSHISKMRQFKTILERYGIEVEIITTTRPGYIVYEDRFQVAAYPFADTPT
ncbi:MAG TPA: hypothetical protein VGG60_02455, partial [Candidatus Binataceae bacterium]